MCRNCVQKYLVSRYRLFIATEATLLKSAIALTNSHLSKLPQALSILHCSGRGVPGANVKYRYFRAKLNLRGQIIKGKKESYSRFDTSPSGLPDGFIDRLSRYAPQHLLNGVLQSFSQPRQPACRVNPLVAQDPGLAARLEEMGAERVDPGGLGRDVAWTLPAASRASLLRDTAVSSGALVPQNVSSMLPVAILDPRPGERVLDLAAAPGLKTLQIAAMMSAQAPDGFQGELAAVEIVRKRFFRMRAFLKNHGAHFVRTFLKDGTRVARHRPDYFDRVLLDAPCTTEGRFVAGNDATIRYWSVRKINEMVHRQRRLAESAVRCLKPGGVLVYSTCTTAPEENEGLVSWLLDQFVGELEIEDVNISGSWRQPVVAGWSGQQYPVEVQRAVRVWPDATREAFFVCRMRKVG